MDEGGPPAGAGPAGPVPPGNQDPEIIVNIFSNAIWFIQQYGWFILIGLAILVYLKNKFSSNLTQWQEQREAASYKKMDGGVAQQRMEAMERSRMKMQETLDAQAREYALKQQQKEEEKRKEKIEDWERHQQGKGYRSKTKAPVENPTSGASGSGGKPSQNQPKKRLRPEYSPLMGAEEVCRFQPGRRGPSMGGG